MIQLASTPVAHVTNTTPSVLDLFRSKDMSGTLHRPIPAPEPNPEPNPGPDAALSNGLCIIAPADWDELFHAVQVRLEQCVDDALSRAAELPLRDRREVTKTAVLQCVDAMRQLQVALTLEREQRQSQPQQHQPHQQQAH